MKKKVLSILMALVMVAGLAVVPSGQSIKAEAAAKKGAVVPVSFNDNVDWDTIDWENNRAEICVWGPDESKTLSADLKAGFTLYVPKSIYNKKAEGEHVLQVDFRLDLEVENGEEREWVGQLRSTPGFALVLPEDGEVFLGVQSYEEDKTVDTSWASVDEDGDYYVITIDGYPLGGTYTKWDDEKEVDVFMPLDANKKYFYSPNISVTPMNGVGGDAVIILDDMVVKDSAAELISQDFESSEKCANKWTKGDGEDWTEIKGSAYTTSLLSLKSKKADIVVGKKAKIKATTVAGTKVTYKSNKPKIASVDAKGNVKGLKKGKAVISVTCCGKTLKYTVKVADKKKK